MKPLKPFDVGAQSVQEIFLQAEVLRKAGKLVLEFLLEGDLQQVSLSAPGAQSGRCDELWRHTCFEAFFSPDGSEEYWELNVSPSLDWNLYHFDRYREGMREEKRVTVVEAKVLERSGQKYRLGIALDISMLGLEAPRLEVGVATVLEHAGSGGHSFWALRHAGEKPDFHLRHSLILALDG